MGRRDRAESSATSLTGKILKGLAVVALVLFPAAWMTYQVISKTVVECEVCIEFRGNRQCRRAQGPDRMACQKTATNNACSYISSGMTDSISCGATAPSSVEFFEPAETGY